MGLLASGLAKKTETLKTIFPEILKNIQALDHGLDVPYRSFEILCNSIDHCEAVFFLKDTYTHLMQPVSAFPQRDMPPPLKDYTDIQSPCLLTETDDIQTWKQYLPSQDMPEKLLIIPIGNNAGEGFLLISRSIFFTRTHENILLLASILSDILTTMIQKTRSPILRNITLHNPPNTSTFAQAIREGSGEHSLLLSFSDTHLTKAFAHSAPHTWETRFQHDLLQVLGSIAQGEGMVAHYMSQFHVFFFNAENLDSITIGQQIQTSLGRAFSIPLPTLQFSETDPAEALQDTKHIL